MEGQGKDGIRRVCAVRSPGITVTTEYKRLSGLARGWIVTDEDPMHWQRGETALLRYRRLGPVTYAFPTTVVDDDEHLTRLYLRPGTPIKRRVLADGRPTPRHIPYREQAALPVIVGDGHWLANHALILLRPGEAHSIRLFWAEHDWTFRGWYVDL